MEAMAMTTPMTVSPNSVSSKKSSSPLTRTMTVTILYLLAVNFGGKVLRSDSIAILREKRKKEAIQGETRLKS